MNNQFKNQLRRPRTIAELLGGVNKSTPTPAQRERGWVINYLQNIEVEGMRKSLCFSCAFVKLYDKNNKEYKISRTMTLADVKAVVEEIKKTNNG